VEVCAVGIHDKNLHIAVPTACKYDLFAIRSEDWLQVFAGLRNLTLGGTIIVHDENVGC
jgi:hypothetical protein